MDSSEQLQVNTLNRWVNARLAPSDIEGIGVFAVRDIEKGQRLFLDIMPEIFDLSYKRIANQLPSYISEMLVERWPLIKQGSPFVFPDARYVAYMNHADEANYDAQTDMATRDIKMGEEITEDYRLIEGWQDVFPWLLD